MWRGVLALLAAIAVMIAALIVGWHVHRGLSAERVGSMAVVYCPPGYAMHGGVCG